VAAVRPLHPPAPQYRSEKPSRAGLQNQTCPSSKVLCHLINAAPIRDQVLGKNGLYQGLEAALDLSDAIGASTFPTLARDASSVK